MSIKSVHVYSLYEDKGEMLARYLSSWRDVLETVINDRKLPALLAKTSTQRKRYYSLI